MNIFDLLIVQPIFNLLAFIYGVIPGSDFGVALIIFTILVRLAMWPLVTKQLHQTKVQREIQPELKRIKRQANGNKQVEGQLMLELYREKGINPMSSIGTLFLQLPIFFALFSVIQIITQHREKIESFTYSFIEQLDPIYKIIHSADHYFNESLLGLVNLSKTAIENGAIYWPVLILAFLAAVLQYIQSKQITPQPTEKKRLRDIMSDSASGKEVDQTEVSAIMSQRMMMFLPIMTFMFMVALPGAIALYTVVGSIVAIIQQHIVLGRDVNEMEVLADTTSTTKSNERADAAIEAEIVSIAPKVRKQRK